MINTLKYIVKRILNAIPVLIGVSLIAFVLGIMAPGDPALEILTMDGMSYPTQEELQAMREEMGLNDPIIIQYFNWGKNALKGDLGRSYMTNEPVFDEIIRRLPITFSIASLAVIIAVLLGIPLGVLMAFKRYSLIDHLGRVIGLMFISIPGFWLSFMLITVFSEKLKVLPTSGYGSFRHLILPSIILASGTIGVIMRLNRATLIEEINKNYILTARSKGLFDRMIIVHHSLLNSIMPVITYLGNYFGGILGGSAIIETIFAIPGIGSFVVDGIFSRDYPVIQGYVLFMGIAYILFNLLVDICYVMLNPQIRLGGKN
ncbi:nickel ABC transporter permease [Maledivibacter halophilus]|uniref:Nickel import system permease protein NikB n=1 Tax=Maledivibacter halophilus TaxID=36842 RepID=A0A1T5M060_9FIRM|nr:nickel ABC transporter permease [Maledivibacter halophilus]SKC81424.1 peptide/nickel transport system permease protein [Maledivibacter halophilus]